MPHKFRPLFFTGAFLLIVACATGAVMISRAVSKSKSAFTQGSSSTRITVVSTNLSLQPEAARVHRRLGNRFNSSSTTETTATGILRIAGVQHPVTIVRRLDQNGELVELLLPEKRLTWNESEGVKATSNVPTQTELLMAERLIFDTADHFVLAQLRGATYHTVVRNLRPDDAGDYYTGPLWTVVRLSVAQPSNVAASISPWRLYYINEATELIDRIVCELDSRKIETTIRWAEQNGEQIPTHLKWTTKGEILMEYEVTAFSQTK